MYLLPRLSQSFLPAKMVCRISGVADFSVKSARNCSIDFGSTFFTVVSPHPFSFCSLFYPAGIRIESGITIETTYIFYLCKNGFHIFLRTFHNTQKRKCCFLSKAHFLLFSYSPLYPAPYNSHACSNSRSVCSVPFEVSREILFIRISRSSICSMIRILTHGYGRPSAPVT